MSKGDKELSNTALSLLTLLNNINELISISFKKAEARDVMKALTIYAKQKNFKLPEDKISNFHFILLDSRPITISYLLRNIAADIVKEDMLKKS
jgi:hypothetical protein